MNEKVSRYLPIVLFIINTVIVAPFVFIVEQQRRVTNEYRERIQRQLEEQEQINYRFMREFVTNERFIALQDRIEQRITNCR